MANTSSTGPVDATFEFLATRALPRGGALTNRESSFDWRITEHAIDRFIKYCTDPSSLPSRAKVRRLLLRAARTARKLAAKTPLGDPQWEVDEPPCVLVTKQDDHRAPIVCVTVLPSYRRGYSVAEQASIQAKIDEINLRAARLREAAAKAAEEAAATDRLRELKLDLQLTMVEASLLKQHARTARLLIEEAQAERRKHHASTARNVRGALGLPASASEADVLTEIRRLRDAARAYKEIGRLRSRADR